MYFKKKDHKYSIEVTGDTEIKQKSTVQLLETVRNKLMHHQNVFIYLWKQNLEVTIVPMLMTTEPFTCNSLTFFIMHLGKGHGLSTVDRIGLLVIFIYNKNGKYKKNPKKTK